MKIFRAILPVLILLLAGSAFTAALDNYEAIEGQAVITVVKKSVYDPDPKGPGYMEIRFNFTPGEKGRAANYKYKRYNDKNVQLFVDNRGDLPKQWVDSKRITVGKTYRAVRYEKKGGGGSMPPVIYRIPEFDSKNKNK